MPLTKIQAGIIDGAIGTENLNDNAITFAKFAAEIRKINIQDSYVTGEYFTLDDYYPRQAFDAIAALDSENGKEEVYWPAICLDQIDIYEDINETNFPVLVPKLRLKKTYYRRGHAEEKSDFDITNWSITTNVGTLTFSDTTEENIILSVLTNDLLSHINSGGTVSNWRTITLAGAIGNIPAGDYAIADVDALARTISFAVTAADGSGAVTATASFYPHRVAGSTTTARLFEVAGKTIASPDASDRVSGLRVLDQMQGWQLGVEWVGTTYYAFSNVENFTVSASAQAGDASFKAKTDQQGSSNMYTSVSDGTNGTPRTGAETHGSEMVGHLYIWGRTYVA